MHPVASDKKGNIRILKHLEAAGMKGGSFFRLKKANFVRLPQGSRLFRLPGRAPAAYDPETGRFLIADGFPAVAAFTPPGYLITYNSAYRAAERTVRLPLFTYAAVAHHGGELYAAAVMVDRDLRHATHLVDVALLKTNIRRLRGSFRHNRLLAHLANCAVSYGCPNACNLFLRRYEAPLVASRRCNARCAGCISAGRKRSCAGAHERIGFTPTPEEIAETALIHIQDAETPVVSFGQGCEGEPLLAAGTVSKAIRLIRKHTSKGMINMNTNASRPALVRRLFDAGLDSMRVSLNSARPVYYNRYYRPADYSFGDVIRSIRSAKRMGGFVSLNYLTMPGFTDLREEFAAFTALTADCQVDMVQWRNLSFDPIGYFSELAFTPRREEMMGVAETVRRFKRSFPDVLCGYFNPVAFTIRPRAAVSRRRQRRGL